MSVIVPAFNEQDGIAGTVAALSRWLDAAGRGPAEIIVVDNASEDATRERVAPFVDGERVQLLVNETNIGKGGSVRRGMLVARGAILLHCDADCTPSLASLPAMLDLLDDHDLVVGSRIAAGARLGQRQPLRRRFMGRGFQQLCRVALAEPTKDLFCGFKLWRAPAARDVFSRVALTGWTFDAEAIALARALGYRVTETGIAWADREGSRLSMLRILVPVVRELAQARRHVRREAARGPAAVPVVAPDAPAP